MHTYTYMHACIYTPQLKPDFRYKGKIGSKTANFNFEVGNLRKKEDEEEKKYI